MSFQKISSWLRIRSVVAGLDINDEVLRLAYFNGKLWQMQAIRLIPGTIQGGLVKNREALVSSLIELKKKSNLGGREGKKKANVVVALSSATPYSKVFSLPMIDEVKGDELDKAIALNIQMASPGEKDQMYSGWEIVNRDKENQNIEILSSFIERSMVDGIVDALFSSGFTPVAIESKALALTRVLREKGVSMDNKKPYIFVDVDSGGVEFLVVKGGVPYFEYANHWSDLSGEKGEIDIETFKKELAASLRQVLNFYAQQWPEPLSAVVLSTVLFREEVEKTIVANAGVPAVRLTLEMGQPISSEWLAALGACLRISSNRNKIKDEISFLGEELRYQYHQEEAIRFLEFWRVVVPVAFAILVGIMVVANVFIVHAREQLETQSSFRLIPSENSTISQMEASSTAFNHEVALVKNVEDHQTIISPIITAIQGIAATSGVMISHLSYNGSQSPILLTGIASTQNQISLFKTVLQANSHISAISLPLTDIQPAGSGYSFSATFNYQ